MATDGMDKLDLRLKSTWEILYRKFVGIIPGEENQQEYGCIIAVLVLMKYTRAGKDAHSTRALLI